PATRRDDAEGPAPAEASVLDARGSLRGCVRGRARRPAGEPRRRREARPLLGEAVLRHRRARPARGGAHRRRRTARAALPVPDRRGRGAARALYTAPGGRLGTGGATE